MALHEPLTYELGLLLHSEIIGVHTVLVWPGQLRTALFKGMPSPSRLLAPILEPHHVSHRIVEAIDYNRVGDLQVPFYTRLIPLLRALL